MENNQKAAVYWFFGLSGSGKSSLSALLFDQLRSMGKSVVKLDGDQLRAGLNSDLGFTSEDRLENIRRAAELAKLFLDNEQIVLASFITPEEIHREKVREILGDSVQFIFVDATLETCQSRDVKGLYRDASNGDLGNFTGISAPFERPSRAEFILDTNLHSKESCLNQLMQQFFSL